MRVCVQLMAAQDTIDAFITNIDNNVIHFNSTQGSIAIQHWDKEIQFLLSFRKLSAKQEAFEQRICSLSKILRGVGQPPDLSATRKWDLRQFARDNADVVPSGFTLQHSHLHLQSMVHPTPYLAAVGESLFNELMSLAEDALQRNWATRGKEENSWRKEEPNFKQVVEQIKANAKIEIVKRKPFVEFHDEVPIMVVTFTKRNEAYSFSRLFKNDTFNLRKDVRVHIFSEPSLTAYLARCGMSLQDRVKINVSRLKAGKNVKQRTTAKTELSVRSTTEFLACVTPREGVDVQSPGKLAYEYLKGPSGVCAIAVKYYGGAAEQETRIACVESLFQHERDDVMDIAASFSARLVLLNTEEALLTHFVDFVRSKDPDFLVSVDGFFGSRLSDLFVKHPKLGDRLSKVEVWEKSTTRKKLKRESVQGAGDTDCEYLDLGRAQIDIKHLVVQDFKPLGTRLKVILSTLLSAKSQEECETFNLMNTETWQISREEPSAHGISWLLTLVSLVHKAETDGNVVAQQVAMSGITNTAVMDIQMKGQFLRIDNMLYSLGNKKYFMNINEFTFGQFPRAPSNSGGNVVQPLPGMLKGKPVYLLDFSSMYPSIMIAHNMNTELMVPEASVARLRKQGYIINDMISFAQRGNSKILSKKGGGEEEGERGAGGANGDGGGEDSEDDMDDEDDEAKEEKEVAVEEEGDQAENPGEQATSAPRNVALHFVQKLPNGTVPQGLITTVLNLTISQRKKCKDLAASEKDPEKRNFYDVQQKVWKIVCNSVYGLMMLIYPPYGCCVTSAGRLDQALAITLATSRHVCQKGLMLLMGDTDSIIVSGKLDQKMRERAWKVLKELLPDLGEMAEKEKQMWRDYDSASETSAEGTRVMRALFKDHVEIQRMHMAFGVWLERFFAKHYKPPIKLALEHFATEFLLLSNKKQYGVLVYSFDPKSPNLSTKPKLKQQGIGNKRDIPSVFRDFQNGAVAALCKEANPLKALECFFTAIDKLRSPHTHIDELAFSVRVRLKTDKKNSLVQGNVLKLLKKAQFPVSAGDMMRYVFIVGGNKAAECAHPVELFDPTKHKIQTMKYIERFLSVATVLLDGIVNTSQLIQYARGQQALPERLSGSKRPFVGAAGTNDMKDAKKQKQQEKEKRKKSLKDGEGQALLPVGFGGSASGSMSTSKRKADEAKAKKSKKPKQDEPASATMSSYFDRLEKGQANVQN